MVAEWIARLPCTQESRVLAPLERSRNLCLFHSFIIPPYLYLHIVFISPSFLHISSYLFFIFLHTFFIFLGPPKIPNFSLGPVTPKNSDLSSYIWALGLKKNPSYLIYIKLSEDNFMLVFFSLFQPDLFTGSRRLLFKINSFLFSRAPITANRMTTTECRANEILNGWCEFICEQR